jgi:group I intron endonuclease
MKISGIYKIQSGIMPNRIYIGSAVNIEHRWLAHLYDLRKNRHHSGKLQNHYNKYGESDLIFSIIVGCAKENLISYEQFYIDALNPYFNICKVAGNCEGIKLTEEHKKKISLALVGRKCSEETKRKISLRHKGRISPNKSVPMSEEQKAKLRIANKGQIMTDEQRLKCSIAHKGKPSWNKGIPWSDEMKIKLSIAHKGKKYNKEIA